MLFVVVLFLLSDRFMQSDPILNFKQKKEKRK